jgi:6-pyruvoyltetrahydropterin/6-carboxytetrahydropterin synthase
MKCFNIHGHTYLYELVFSFSQMQEIGYQIDFKEIKRIGCQWIDDALDHGAILNPKDVEMWHAAFALRSKCWAMSLSGEANYCNPSVENLSKELFLALEILFEGFDLSIHEVVLYETPNCLTRCTKESIPQNERDHFYALRGGQLRKYASDKGKVEYDDRKTK